MCRPSRIETITLRRCCAARSRPGDRVQILDTTEGGADIALRAHLEPASRFIYDFHFFHDVGTAVNSKLRRELMKDLTRSRPRFFLFFAGNWGPRSSFDAISAFPELASFIAPYRVILVNCIGAVPRVCSSGRAPRPRPASPLRRCGSIVAAAAKPRRAKTTRNTGRVPKSASSPKTDRKAEGRQDDKLAAHPPQASRPLGELAAVRPRRLPGRLRLGDGRSSRRFRR